MVKPMPGWRRCLQRSGRRSRGGSERQEKLENQVAWLELGEDGIGRLNRGYSLAIFKLIVTFKILHFDREQSLEGL